MSLTDGIDTNNENSKNIDRSSVGKTVLITTVVVGTLVGTLGYKLAQNNTIENVIALQRAKQITKPYDFTIGTDKDTKDRPAKANFLHMNEGQQFWYHGHPATLFKRYESDKGYTDIFLVGKEFVEIPTSNLPDDLSIEQTFQKYHQK